MVRLLCCFAVLAMSFCLIAPPAGANQKKPVDASSFAGKITDVNVDEKSKKVESLYVQVGRNKKNVPITEKTKVEFVGFPDKESEKFMVGQTAEVKMDFQANSAITVKVTGSAAKKKK